ncbi:hypothetical protein PsYK624_159580 [Phanerochaete sordida]|uniref:Uncharacterized protein n=1 Tax=Phanerochaete sordida TaxID=48140 RepID=A0A9P3LMV1_9APHY|nr:hypothetical protein PsYK624_159580 [Phanerochaete sordida]
MCATATGSGIRRRLLRAEARGKAAKRVDDPSQQPPGTSHVAPRTRRKGQRRPFLSIRRTSWKSLEAVKLGPIADLPVLGDARPSASAHSRADKHEIVVRWQRALSRGLAQTTSSTSWNKV